MRVHTHSYRNLKRLFLFFTGKHLLPDVHEACVYQR